MKRPSQPSKSRATSGAGGPGPKTRRSPASSTSKRGPARGEGGRARPSAESAADGPAPRKTTGVKTRSRGSTPPAKPYKGSATRAGGRTGAKPGPAHQARPNPGVTARRSGVEREAGPEDSRGDARKRGAGAGESAGRSRGAGAAAGADARQRGGGGKAGPRGMPVNKRGPGAKVGSRGRVERPGPGARVGSRGKSGEGFEARKPVRGAGGDTPPRRGSAVERLLAGGEPGDRPTRPRAVRDEFEDSPPAKRSRSADAPAAKRSEGAATKRGGAVTAKRSSGAAPAKRSGAAPAKRSGDEAPAKRAAPAKRGGDAVLMKRRAVVDADDVTPVTSAVVDATAKHDADDVTPVTPAAKREAKPAGDAATPGVAPKVRGWSETPSAKPKRATPRPASNQIKSAERLAPQKIRLQKVLASAGVAARRKAEDLIARGRVTVNGKVASELGVKVDPERDQIRVDGKVVQVETRVYFVLNKPDGVVSSAEGKEDAEGRPTVLSLLPAVTQRIYPVGRLDYHSRGVLILTNDGDLAAALTHPRHKVTKTYHVKFQGRLDDAALTSLSQGITLDDGVVTRPAEEVSIIKETETNTWLQITLRQGLNRQVRRMGDAIGHPVLKLIRVAVGSVTADGLEDGEFRPLTPTEVYDLMAAASR